MKTVNSRYRIIHASAKPAQPRMESFNWRIAGCVFASFLTLGSFLGSARGQMSESGAATEPTGDIVSLNAFEVKASKASPYQSSEANSSGRIAMPLIETPQSVGVITGSFMNDLGISRILSAASFTPGVTESSIPNGLDRMTIRGFQVDPAQQSMFIDGFKYSAVGAQTNMDSANIERMEIVKGPNAIIAPNGSPGGAVNIVTKAPDNRAGGYINIAYGTYSSNRAEMDYNQPLITTASNWLGVRLVAAAVDNKSWIKGDFDKSQHIAPSIRWKIGKSTEITLKGEWNEGTAGTSGLIIDPSVGPGTKLALYPGLSAKAPAQDEADHRTQRLTRGEFEAVHRFSDDLQVRVGFSAFQLSGINQNGGLTGSAPAVVTSAGSRINPVDGVFTPNTTYAVTGYGTPAQTVTATPVAAANPADLTTGFFYSIPWNFNLDQVTVLQTDVVYKHQFPFGVKSSTVAGYSATTHTVKYDVWNNINSPTLVGTLNNPDFAAMRAAAYATLPADTKINDADLLETTSQGYISEVISTFEDKLFLSGSFAAFEYFQRANANAVGTNNPDGLAAASSPYNASVAFGPGYAANAWLLEPGFQTLRKNQNTISFGIVYKPIKDVSVYYGRNENVNPPPLNALGSQNALNAYGTQHELGVKTELLDGAINLTADYFSIVEHNQSIWVATGLASGSFVNLGNVTSRGAEFGANVALAKSWNIIGSFSAYKARDGFGRVLRTNPDTIGSLVVRYAARSGTLKGFWVMPGITYTGTRAGDGAGTYSVSSTTPGFIAGAVNGRALDGASVQPTFYLPSMTVGNLTLGYTLPKWSFTIQVQNITNESYIASSISRASLYPGAPRYVFGTVQYKF